VRSISAYYTPPNVGHPPLIEMNVSRRRIAPLPPAEQRIQAATSRVLHSALIQHGSHAMQQQYGTVQYITVPMPYSTVLQYMYIQADHARRLLTPVNIGTANIDRSPRGSSRPSSKGHMCPSATLVDWAQNAAVNDEYRQDS